MADDDGFYSNFGSPVSLLRRMLATRDGAAYGALARVAIRMLAIPLDRAWRRREAVALARVGLDEHRADAHSGERHRQVFVVGGARCGTTFTCQVLAAGLDVGWFDNVAELFPGAPITAMRRLRRDRWESVGFRSFYGNTGGWGDPNDAFFVWNRWLGSDRYTASLPEDPATRDELRRYFALFGSTFDADLLNKNNRNLLVAEELCDVLPDAHIVSVTRDPMETVASLVEARRMTHGDRSQRWGVMSQSTHADRHELGYVDDVCHQVAGYRRRTEEIAAALGDRCTTVSLERVRTEPRAVVEEISRRSGVARRADIAEPEIRPARAGARLTPAEEQRARTVLTELGVI